MGQKRGRKRTALTPPPDSRVVPGQPEGSEIGSHSPPQPGPSRPQSNSASASSFGDTDLSIKSSPTNSASISLFPNISGRMADSVTRWTIEHSEKERLVQLEVTDIKAKIKHIEHLIKENHPQWHIVAKCVQLKERVDSFETLSKDLQVQRNKHQPATYSS